MNTTSSTLDANNTGGNEPVQEEETNAVHNASINQPNTQQQNLPQSQIEEAPSTSTSNGSQCCVNANASEPSATAAAAAANGSACSSAAVACETTVNDCCVTIPEGAGTAGYLNSNQDRIVGVIQAKGYVHGILKPDEFNLRHSRHAAATAAAVAAGRSGLGDVTLNLTEFLSYAQRNNYDIVIPASRDVCSVSRSANANLSRIGGGRGYMVLEQQHFPTDFSDSSNFQIAYNNMPSRNSVLAPNMYAAEEIQPPAVDFSAPPPYEMPLKLPTYEEVQREKALEGEILPPTIESQNVDPNSPRTLSFLAIDTDMGTNPDTESKLLGTDFMFGVAFFLALVFNWVGFLLLMCFCHTVAARYGALSGFGLSLAKWTIIVKNSTEVPIHNAWLWWLITAFGLLICIRSLFQYINIKRGWRLMSTATQERLLFFY